MGRIERLILSDEQFEFVNLALTNENILVDACIGSGKTTAIQVLYDRLKDKGKNVLYLTYNRLLKIDAVNKIKEKNKLLVNNYHGFAWRCLYDIGVQCAPSDLIQVFLKYRNKVRIPLLDTLIIDEYQDIDEEISNMLWEIKRVNPNMQIIVVGDIDQKIYDKTRLDIVDFINKFLGEHIKLNFTRCFRLNSKLANSLGRVWGKNIIGMNDRCTVEDRSIDEVVNILKNEKCNDILCLGLRGGNIAHVLNRLEYECPEKFNKRTVYASIRDDDRSGVKLNKRIAVFTTYDGSKGMERDICVIFDWTDGYWDLRLNKDGARYEIIRNVFCVAASRGKKRIIFVKDDYENKLSFDTIMNNRENRLIKTDYTVSDMFDFKYKEDIMKLYEMIKVRKIEQEDTSIIDVKSNDALIDLSPCIGMLQEISYFDKYDIDAEVEWYKSLYKGHVKNYDVRKEDSPEKKILYMTALEQNQDRYMRQVKMPFIAQEKLNNIHNRLGRILSKNENVQVKCAYYGIDDGDSIIIKGRADVVKDRIVYELKFVNELRTEHYLQCVCYMIMLGLDSGILWNIKNNDMYILSIDERDEFMRRVFKTVRKIF